MSLWSVIGGIGGFLVGGPAGAAIGASLGGAADSSNATNKAVGAQTDASNRSDALTREQMAQQQRIADQARADNEPWRVQGGAALNKLAAAPEFKFDGTNVGTDPGYQFGLNEGMKGLTNSAAARGSLLSGAALKASTKYAQDYAGTKFNDSFSRALQTDTVNKNRLQSLAGIGQTAVGANQQAGQVLGGQLGQAGQSLAQNALGVGNARASGYLANGNALTGAVNQGVSAWNQYNALSKPNIYGDGGTSGRAGDYSDNMQLYGV